MSDLAGSLLSSEPEPESEAVSSEEGVPTDPLTSPRVVCITADGEAGELISFTLMAELLREGKLNGASRVFVPPGDLESGSQAVGDMVDMEEVRDMDPDDVAELAGSLMEQLVAPSDSTLLGESQGQSAALVPENVDEIDLACAACAPPLYETLFGHFRAPVELPPALAAAAEREIGETPAKRSAALVELREKMAAAEADGIGQKKKRRTIFFPRKDDQFMVAFLRNQKFRVDDALEKVIAYTEFVAEHASILGSCNPKDDPFLNPKNMKEYGQYILPGAKKRLLCAILY
jgi:hypothetical protein